MELTGRFKTDFEAWLLANYTERYIYSYIRLQEETYIRLFIKENGLDYNDIQGSIKIYNEYYKALDEINIYNKENKYI